MSDEPPPKKCPDVQELVETWGDYSSIPPEAWAAFDRGLADYLERVRKGQLDRDRPI
jgi:hypothetical protein